VAAHCVAEQRPNLDRLVEVDAGLVVAEHRPSSAAPPRARSPP
jgi:hypothetical protein